MKRTNKAPRLTLQRTTLTQLANVQGGRPETMWYGPKSYDANCSGSCNTCGTPQECGGQWYDY